MSPSSRSWQSLILLALDSRYPRQPQRERSLVRKGRLRLLRQGARLPQTKAPLVRSSNKASRKRSTKRAAAGTPVERQKRSSLGCDGKAGAFALLSFNSRFMHSSPTTPRGQCSRLSVLTLPVGA